MKLSRNIITQSTQLVYMPTLRYGNDSTVDVDFAPGTVSAVSDAPRGEALTDLDAATTAALNSPMHFPPLLQSTMAADRVVIALDHGIPEVATITAAIIRNLVEAAVDPDGISILRTAPAPGAEAEDPCRNLPALLRDRIAVVTHDATDRRQLAYLAASESGEAILVNRMLHEADVILPVGCVRNDETPDYFGIHGGIFPAFSDTKTIQRFRSIGSLNGQRNRKRELTTEVDHVAWLLGVNFTIQVIPAAGNRVLHVLCGESEAVRRQSRDLYCAAWGWATPQRATLVVTAIEGDDSQQTWENFGRALHTAEAFTEADGAIVVCCDLALEPGPAMQRFVGNPSRDSALRHVNKERPIDALPAAQLAHTLEQHKVYLLSRLDASTVEDLDIIPVAGPEELNRLIRQYPSCILLANAHNITAK